MKLFDIAKASDLDPKDLPGADISLLKLISGGVDLFLGIIAVTAFIAVIYSGFIYMTAGGDASKTEKAKKNIIWAIIGMFVAVISFAVVRYVGTEFGGS